MIKQRGFTLIELLIVIAIIGVLSSVVLASLNSARTKAKDASVMSTMHSMMSQAAIYYDGTGNLSYGPSNRTRVTAQGMCTTTADVSGVTMFNATTTDGLRAMIDSIISQGASITGIASSTPTSAYSVTYAISASLSTGEYFCVDSTGYSMKKSSDLSISGNGLCR